MNSLEIEHAVLSNMHDLPLEKQQSVLEFTLFIKSMMNSSKAKITQVVMPSFQSDGLKEEVNIDSDLMEHELKPWMALKAFEKGDLSLGQLAKTFGKEYGVRTSPGEPETK